MQVNAFAALVSVLISAILGFGISILAERRFRHLYSSSVKILIYLNFFAFFLIGLGLTQIFNEVSQFIILSIPIRPEVIYSSLLVYATAPLVIFIATFCIAVLNRNLKFSQQSESVTAYKSKKNNSILRQPEEVLSKVTNQLLIAALIIGVVVYITLNFSNLFNANNNSALTQNNSNVTLIDRKFDDNISKSNSVNLQDSKWTIVDSQGFLLKYLDIGNIKRTSKGGTIWMVQHDKEFGSNFIFSKFHFEIDCENKIFRIIAGSMTYKSVKVSEFHSIAVEKINDSPWSLANNGEPYQQQMVKFICNK